MNPTGLRARLTAIALAGFVAATTGGCGLLLVQAPPEGHEQMPYFSCTESNAGPIIDVVVGGLYAVSALLCAADPEGYEDYSGYNAGACVAVGIGMGALLGTSTIVGFDKTKKCRAAKLQLAERQMQQRAPVEAQPIDLIVQSVVLTPSADTLAVGERVQLTASAYNSSGAVIPDRMFAWSSSNDAIASVSSAGLVTAHATGEVVVAARTDNVVGTASLVVVSRR